MHGEGETDLFLSNHVMSTSVLLAHLIFRMPYPRFTSQLPWAVLRCDGDVQPFEHLPRPKQRRLADTWRLMVAISPHPSYLPGCKCHQESFLSAAAFLCSHTLRLLPPCLPSPFSFIQSISCLPPSLPPRRRLLSPSFICCRALKLSVFSLSRERDDICAGIL